MPPASTPFASQAVRGHLGAGPTRLFELRCVLSRSRGPEFGESEGYGCSEERRTPEVDARPPTNPVTSAGGHRADSATPSVGDEPCSSDDSEALGADQFNVFILPSGRVFYEFGSQAVAERFFGSRIVANREDLRAVVGELMAEAPAKSVRKTRPAPIDRNLVTVVEFAALVDCAESSVWELIKLGLPSRLIPRIGRRILKAEAEAWLLAGGASRSRTAKRLRKTNGASHGG